MQIFLAHSKTLLPITAVHLPHLFYPPSICLYRATPLLELASSIFRIFCNTIFIFYLHIFSAFSASLSLAHTLFSFSLSLHFKFCRFCCCCSRKPEAVAEANRTGNFLQVVSQTPSQAPNLKPRKTSFTCILSEETYNAPWKLLMYNRCSTCSSYTL